MNKDLTYYLNSKYSKLYVRNGINTYFSCGDGWFNIIESLSANICHYIDSNQKTVIQNKYLLQLIENKDIDNYPIWLKNEFEKNPDYNIRDRYSFTETMLEYPRVEQIKEKFGTLRYYLSGSDDAIESMISMAESMTATTCEVCGNKGKMTQGGWVRVLCDNHAENKKERTLKKDDYISFIKKDDTYATGYIFEVISDNQYKVEIKDDEVEELDYSNAVKELIVVEKVDAEQIVYFKEIS